MASLDNSTLVIGTKVPLTRENKRPKDMRKWTPEQRKNVDQGAIVDIIDAEGKVISRMRKNIFIAATTKPELLVDNQVRLPEEVSKPAVQLFATYINSLPDKDIGSQGIAERDMHLCFAAEALGMRAYIQHLFNLYYEPLKDHTLPYQHLIGITKVDNPLGRKFFKDASYDLATLAWNKEIPDTAAFDQELATNPRLSQSVNKLFSVWETAARNQARHEERRLQKEKADRLAKEREKRKAIAEKEREAKDKKKWAGQKQKDAEIRARVIEKKRTGEKLTREEAAMHYVMYGKHVPI